MKVLRAIYGCIESALLWYNFYLNTLKDSVFRINTYDICVSNKMIGVNQCTIVWYVDDNSLSRVDTIKVYQGDFQGTPTLVRAPRAQAKKIENTNLGFFPRYLPN